MEVKGSTISTQRHLGYIKLHVEVKSFTVSRWLKEILNAAGIDITTFKGHCTESASSLKTCVPEISTEEILMGVMVQ